MLGVKDGSILLCVFIQNCEGVLQVCNRQVKTAWGGCVLIFSTQAYITYANNSVQQVGVQLLEITQ